jgi:outer membrane lipoprotein-sorting protein
MRRTLALAAAGALIAAAIAQTGVAGHLSAFAKALADAKSLSTTYTVQEVGGARDTYTVELKKPNLARVETPDEIIVADGKQITTFDKSDKTFFKQAQTDAALKDIFKADELNLWAGFFDPNAFKNVATKSLGKKSRKGTALDAVEAAYDAKRLKVVTYFLAPGDHLARQASIDLNDPNGKVTIILDTQSLTVGGDQSSNLFAFTAPAGAREITEEELNADKWYTSLDEAKTVAAKTNKLIMVDFYTDW